MAKFRYNGIKIQMKNNYQMIVMDAITKKEVLVQYYDDQIIDNNDKQIMWDEYFRYNTPMKIVP